MKRRICLMGAALGVCLLAFVAGTAIAAGKSKPTKPATQKVTCTSDTSTMIPAGETTVSPPEAQGDHYGTVNCGGALGAGVQKDAFTNPISGDTVARYQLYFSTGTVHGTYDLIPEDGTSLNFLQAAWTGTLKVLGGTGAYRKVTGTGTMACRTLDGIHIACTDRLKLKLPSAG